MPGTPVKGEISKSIIKQSNAKASTNPSAFRQQVKAGISPFASNLALRTSGQCSATALASA